MSSRPRTESPDPATQPEGPSVSERLRLFLGAVRVLPGAGAARRFPPKVHAMHRAPQGRGRDRAGVERAEVTSQQRGRPLKRVVAESIRVLRDLAPDASVGDAPGGRRATRARALKQDLDLMVAHVPCDPLVDGPLARAADPS